MEFRLTVTWFPSSSENVTRFNMKHTHTQRQKKRAKRTHNHSNVAATRRIPPDCTALLGTVCNLAPCPPANEIKGGKGGDTAFCHSAHTRTHTHKLLRTRPSLNQQVLGKVHQTKSPPWLKKWYVVAAGLLEEVFTCKATCDAGKN